MTPPDVVFACVAENRPDWHWMVEALATSVRTLGGGLAAAPFVAHFIDGVDDAARDRLAGLGVEVRVADRYDAAHPPTNKLRMFEDFAERQQAAFLVALDCDTVVVGDLLSQARAGCLRARPAMVSPMSSTRWARLLESLSLAPAATSTTMIWSGREIPAPYVNSGVMVLPVEQAGILTTAWSAYIAEFVRQGAAGVRQPWTGYFLDQIALSCALLDQAISVEPLSLGMNLPTDRDLGSRLPADPEPAIGVLHYHKHLSPEGLLLPAGVPVVDRHIDRVNRVLAARPRAVAVDRSSR